VFERDAAVCVRGSIESVCVRERVVSQTLNSGKPEGNEEATQTHLVGDDVHVRPRLDLTLPVAQCGERRDDQEWLRGAADEPDVLHHRRRLRRLTATTA
jgi:hypothetical protein